MATTRNMPLSGQRICLTGTLSMSRAMATKALTDLGASITNGVTKSTNILIVGDKPGSKLDAANRLHVPVWSEEDFQRVLEMYSVGRDAVITGVIPDEVEPKSIPAHYGDF